MAHHRDAGVDDRLRAIGRCAAALELDRVAAGFLDEALSVRDRLLVRGLVAAERHVADQQRGLQSATHRAGEHHHLVHRDRGGVRVAEHDHRRRVADQHEIDAGLVDDGGATGSRMP